MKFTKLCSFIFDMLPNPVNTDFPKHIGIIAKLLNDVKCRFSGLISFSELFLEFSSKLNFVGSDLVSIRGALSRRISFSVNVFWRVARHFFLKSLYMTAARRSNNFSCLDFGISTISSARFYGYILCDN